MTTAALGGQFEVGTVDGGKTRVKVPEGTQNGKPFALTARSGVIITTGGFEWDEDMRQTFLRGPMDAPASPPTASGGGLKLAMASGAKTIVG